MFNTLLSLLLFVFTGVLLSVWGGKLYILNVFFSEAVKVVNFDDS